MLLVPSTDGVEVAVHDLGGEGAPLLFAHATGFHGRVWEPVARRLRDRFRCWAVDFRGHGDAVTPDDHSFDWHGFADDVLAVVDALDLRSPFGVGHSKGGAALLLAEEARPGTFRALYCYEPIVMPALDPPGSNDDHPLARGALRRRETFPSRQDAYDNYAAKPPFAALDADALRAYVEHGFRDEPDGTVRLKCRAEHEARVYAMGGGHGGFAALPGVRCPVTVAAGWQGDGMPSLWAPAIAERLPAGRLEEHDDLGHFGPLEDPGRIAGEIARAFSGT